VALQRPQPANQRIARWKIHTVRSQSPVSQLPNHRAHPPVFTAKQNSRQKRRHESLSILGESANLAGDLCDRAIYAIGQFMRSGDLYRFRLDGNDKVKVNNSPFPHGRLPTPHHSGVTGIDIIRSGDRQICCRETARRRVLNALFSQNIPCRPYL